MTIKIKRLWKPGWNIGIFFNYPPSTDPPAQSEVCYGTRYKGSYCGAAASKILPTTASCGRRGTAGTAVHKILFYPLCTAARV